MTLRGVTRDVWAGVLTACVFYAEYVSLGAALGDALPGRTGAALGALMVLGAVVLGCAIAVLLPRPLLAGPRGASLAVLIAGMKFASAQATVPEVRMESAVAGLMVILLTAAAMQLLGLLKPVQNWIADSNVAMRKGFMFASGIGIVVGLGTTQLQSCLHVDPVATAAVATAGVIAALTWGAACKYPGLRHTPLVRLAPLAIPIGVATATIGYYLFIADHAAGGYCGTLGSNGLRLSLLSEIAFGPHTVLTAWHYLPLWVWPVLLLIGSLLGGVMLLETLTTLRDSKDRSDRSHWPSHIGGNAFGNAVGALLGFSCVSLSTSRTNALVESQANSRIAVLVHGACVLVIGLCLTSVIARLPQLAIAVALMVVAIQIIDDDTRKEVWSRGYRPDATAQTIHTTWIFLGVVGSSALIGMGLMKLGWGFGGGPLLALVLAAVLLRKGRTMGDQGHVVSSGR